MLQDIKKWSLALETVDSRTLAPTHNVTNTHENNFFSSRHSVWENRPTQTKSTWIRIAMMFYTKVKCLNKIARMKIKAIRPPLDHSGKKGWEFGRRSGFLARMSLAELWYEAPSEGQD